MEFTEEQILLRALSRGDEKAFEVLFMRYFPRVKRFISGLLQDDITAEDFAQDILLKLWQKREEMAKSECLPLSDFPECCVPAFTTYTFGE